MTKLRPGYKRIVVEVKEDDYKRLRSLLALESKTVSDWIRGQILYFIAKGGAK